MKGIARYVHSSAMLAYVPSERGLLARAEGGGVGAVDHGKGRTERRHRGQSEALGVLAAAHLLAPGLAVAVALARLLSGDVGRATAPLLIRLHSSGSMVLDGVAVVRS